MTDYYDPFDSVAHLLAYCVLLVILAVCLGIGAVFGLTADPDEGALSAMFWPAVGVVVSASSIVYLWVTNPSTYIRTSVEPTKPWPRGE